MSDIKQDFHFYIAIRIISGVFFIIVLLGCEIENTSTQLDNDSVRILANTPITLVLQTDLSSNSSNRGDVFVATLKEPFKISNKEILPSSAKIHGLVKRSNKYIKFGDKASLFLIFDQLELSDMSRLPIAATLDTDKGRGAVKIKGKEMEDTKMVFGMAVVGGLLANAASDSDKQETTKNGLMLGAMLGTTAVMIANTQEIQLPAGTEITVKLEKDIVIPYQ